MAGTERVRRSSVAVTLGVSALVLGPLLVRGGIALHGDMVFTPDQPWKPAGLGLSGSVPRAVPMDAFVSIADEVLPGAVLQRLLLLAALVLGGLGIARLCRGSGAWGQAAAVVLFLWNPWVHERLGIGQWAMVLGYGLLPWLVLACARLRERAPGGWAATTVLLVACAVCAPSMGLIGVLVAVAVVLAGGWRPTVGVLGTGALANLPWLVPALLGPGLQGDPAQFTAFAARGESSLGTLASLLSLGGIWKSSVVAPERELAVVVAVALVLSLACLAAYGVAASRLDRPARRTAYGVAGAGAASLLLALLPSVGPVARALGELSTHVAAVGILRDSQRYLAPLGLVLAWGAAVLVQRLVERGRSSGPGLGAVAALVVVAPVVLLPSMAWGLSGDLRPVSYPGDWERVAALTRVSAEDGDATVVLPWRGNYRGYAWNDRSAVLDPAERFLPGEVLVDDRLFLGDRVLRSEDPLLGRVTAALDGPDPAGGLRGIGVRWVLVEKDNGVEDGAVPAGSVAFDGRWLRLVDLGPPDGDLADVRDRPPAWPVLLADFVVLATACVSFWHLWLRIVRNQPKQL